MHSLWGFTVFIDSPFSIVHSSRTLSQVLFSSIYSSYSPFMALGHIEISLKPFQVQEKSSYKGPISLVKSRPQLSVAILPRLCTSVCHDYNLRSSKERILGAVQLMISQYDKVLAYRAVIIYENHREWDWDTMVSRQYEIILG